MIRQHGAWKRLGVLIGTWVLGEVRRESNRTLVVTYASIRKLAEQKFEDHPEGWSRLPSDVSDARVQHHRSLTNLPTIPEEQARGPRINDVGDDDDDGDDGNIYFSYLAQVPLGK
eukprot:2606788-Amphidinium_carterae.1